MIRRSSNFNDRNEFIFKKKKLFFNRIWGGIAWPGDKPGFGVIIGETYEKGPGGRYMHVLAEVETFHSNELVRECIKLQQELRVSSFWGQSTEADTAYILFHNKIAHENGLPYFNVHSTIGPEDEFLVYQINILRDCLAPERKSLFMFDESVLPGYLLDLSQSVHKITNVQYPAVAALGYVITALVGSAEVDHISDEDIYPEPEETY